jgi:putative peptidoglycan lipid II flippase
MKRRAGIMFVLKGARLAISILNLYLSASYFGVSIEKDIWLLAINIFLILDMAIWGPINETFRAKFVFLREEFGEEIALQRTRSLIVFTNSVTIILVLLILWKPELISAIIAPSYKGEQLVLLLFMIRVIAPSFLFNQITQLFTSILNAYNSVYIPEIAGFISGIINLFLIVTLAPKIGIFSLAYAYYIGLFLLLILLLFQIKYKKIKLFVTFKGIKFSDSWPFILFALPFFLPYFIGQIALVVEKSIASSLGFGVVSTIDYAKKFSDIITGILFSVLITVFVPILSSHFIKNDGKAFLLDFRQIYQLGFLVITSFVAILTACPNALVSILYQNNKISSIVLDQISSLATCYSWCAAAIFFYYIFGFGLMSSQKQKYYASYGIAAQLGMIAINLFFNKTLGIYVFPLSLFLSHAIAAFFMFRKLPYGRSELVLITVKYLCVLLSVVLLMYVINNFLIFFSSAYLVLLINIFVLGAILLGALFFLKLDERLVFATIYQRFFGSNNK